MAFRGPFRNGCHEHFPTVTAEPGGASVPVKAHGRTLPCLDHQLITRRKPVCRRAAATPLKPIVTCRSSGASTLFDELAAGRTPADHPERRGANGVLAQHAPDPFVALDPYGRFAGPRTVHAGQSQYVSLAAKNTALALTAIPGIAPPADVAGGARRKALAQ